MVEAIPAGIRSMEVMAAIITESVLRLNAAIIRVS